MGTRPHAHDTKTIIFWNGLAISVAVERTVEPIDLSREIRKTQCRCHGDLERQVTTTSDIWNHSDARSGGITIMLGRGVDFKGRYWPWRCR